MSHLCACPVWECIGQPVVCWVGCATMLGFAVYFYINLDSKLFFSIAYTCLRQFVAESSTLTV